MGRCAEKQKPGCCESVQPGCCSKCIGSFGDNGPVIKGWEGVPKNSDQVVVKVFNLAAVRSVSACLEIMVRF